MTGHLFHTMLWLSASATTGYVSRCTQLPRGDFSMELGSMADSYLDASGDRSPQYGQASKVPGMGISRLELINCELRAKVSGFQSSVISLVELTPMSSTMNVGAIVVHRATKIKGMTLSAAPYKAPRDARRAYEKGLEAERNGRLADCTPIL